MTPSRFLVLGACCSLAGACSDSSSGSDVETTTVPETTTTVAARSVVEAAAYDDALSTFATAVNVAGLTAELEGEGPYTVFVPDADAFAELPNDRLTELLAGDHTDEL